MNLRKTILTIFCALVVVGVGASALAPTAMADALMQSVRRIGNTFIVTSVGNAALDVDQRGAGAILNLSDGGVDEYTFDLSAATFLNQLNMTGALNIDGAVDLDGVITNAANLEHIGLPTWVSTVVPYTAAAGGTVTVATIGAGEVWIVHDIRVDVTTNFDATGDDATMVIGDGNDPDGFCVLADAELQAADTEGTGWSAGWQCQVAATRGAYIDGLGGFVYDEASTETIDAVIDETSGETLTAGSATVHILYTRIQ